MTRPSPFLSFFLTQPVSADTDFLAPLCSPDGCVFRDFACYIQDLLLYLESEFIVPLFNQILGIPNTNMLLMHIRFYPFSTVRLIFDTFMYYTASNINLGLGTLSVSIPTTVPSLPTSLACVDNTAFMPIDRWGCWFRYWIAGLFGALNDFSRISNILYGFIRLIPVFGPTLEQSLKGLFSILDKIIETIRNLEAILGGIVSKTINAVVALLGPAIDYVRAAVDVIRPAVDWIFGQINKIRRALRGKFFTGRQMLFSSSSVSFSEEVDTGDDQWAPWVALANNAIDTSCGLSQECVLHFDEHNGIPDEIFSAIQFYDGDIPMDVITNSTSWLCTLQHLFAEAVCNITDVQMAHARDRIWIGSSPFPQGHQCKSIMEVEIYRHIFGPSMLSGHFEKIYSKGGIWGLFWEARWWIKWAMCTFDAMDYTHAQKHYGDTVQTRAASFRKRTAPTVTGDYRESLQKVERVLDAVQNLTVHIPTVNFAVEYFHEEPKNYALAAMIRSRDRKKAQEEVLPPPPRTVPRTVQFVSRSQRNLKGYLYPRTFSFYESIEGTTKFVFKAFMFVLECLYVISELVFPADFLPYIRYSIDYIATFDYAAFLSKIDLYFSGDLISDLKDRFFCSPSAGFYNALENPSSVQWNVFCLFRGQLPPAGFVYIAPKDYNTVVVPWNYTCIAGTPSGQCEFSGALPGSVFYSNTRLLPSQWPSVVATPCAIRPTCKDVGMEDSLDALVYLAAKLVLRFTDNTTFDAMTLARSSWASDAVLGILRPNALVAYPYLRVVSPDSPITQMASQVISASSLADVTRIHEVLYRYYNFGLFDPTSDLDFCLKWNFPTIFWTVTILAASMVFLSSTASAITSSSFVAFSVAAELAQSIVLSVNVANAILTAARTEGTIKVTPASKIPELLT